MTYDQTHLVVLVLALLELAQRLGYLQSMIVELYLQSHRYDENTRKNCDTSILEHNHSDIVWKLRQG
jgi:hypothetical protein